MMRRTNCQSKNIVITKESVTKTYWHRETFERELMNLQMLACYDFVPHIIDIDCNTLSIIMTNCGIALDQVNLKYYDTEEIIRQLQLIDKILEIQGIYHNDYKLSNITITYRTVHLIDFGHASKGSPTRINWFTKSKSDIKTVIQKIRLLVTK